MMNVVKVIIIGWLAFFCLSAVSATTLDQLIDSYDYNFYDGTVNVTTFSDYMKDTDSDGINDTLVINLTTDANASVAYFFIVDLIDNQSLITNYTNATVSSSSKSASVSFDTRLLNFNRYNYTVTLRSQDYGLAYQDYKTQTQNYSTFRRGTSVTSIVSQNNANSTLRIYLLLNVTQNATQNVTVYLAYNNNTINDTTQVALISPSQNVTINIGNETVKGTHYNGTYAVRAVQIGDRSIATNYTTSSYNYEDFAKTSYIKNITSGVIENTSNNLSDALKFNITISVKNTATYALDMVLATPDGDIVATMNKSQALSSGTQVVQLEVAGEDVYSTYHSGTFIVSLVTLSNSTAVVDSVANAHETADYSYADFEPPARPDVVISFATVRSGSIANVTVNVSNIGAAPAYNVVVDLFDNSTYENQSAITSLAVGQSSTVSFISTTSQNNFFTAIVDFDNTIDESNETNNVAGGQSSGISLRFLDLTSGSTTKILEAKITNNGTETLTNLTWRLELGDGTVISNTTNLTIGQSIDVLAEHTYSSGTYTARIHANHTTVNTTTTLSVVVGNSSSASLSATLISPTTNGNLTQNQLTAMTAQVCCSGSSCGTVNVSLDPESAEYTYFSEKHCAGAECTTTLYTTPHFGYEAGEWKSINDLRSFKNTIPINCTVQSDGQHEVECTDYNATYRTLKITLASGGFLENVPIRILKENENRSLVERTRSSVRLLTPWSTATVTIPAALTDEVHVGESSTNVTYIPTNATAFVGRWNATNGSLALFNWNGCARSSNYSAGEKTSISDANTSTSIYGQGNVVGTDYTYCHWMRWQIPEAPNTVTGISSWAYWTGSLNAGADSITKALYIGNVTSQTWYPLNVSTNAFGAVNHTGSVTSGTSFVENASGTYYVYTLLHFNATKAGSTYAYSNFYDTQLQITTGASSNGSNSSNSSGKGLISTVAGTTPFYTNGTNPRAVTLNAADCQNITWYVNATGTINANYSFFAYANMTTNMSVNARTSTINLTIVNATAGGGSNGSNSSLIHNHTFASSAEGWGGGTQNSAYGGYYEETSDFSTIYSGDLDLTNFSAYRIVMIMWVNDSTNAKFSPESDQLSLSPPYFFYERDSGDMYIKLFNGSYTTISTSVPYNTNVTWTIDVNRTKACFNASFSWFNGSASMTEKCAGNTTKDYVHWDAGDLTGFHRVMDFKVYNLG